MVMWMARSARTLSGELKGQVDRAADAGRAGLVVVALLAVGREGLETALFLWAATQAAASGTGSDVTPLAGAALGIGTAVLLGYLFYRGALHLNLGRFFGWTGAILILVAAGVLSYGVHDLQEASLLPGEHALAFDVSNIVEPGSWLAALLKGTLNFSPATTWLEAVVWVAYVAVAMTLFVGRISRPGTPTTRPVPAKATP
jgi:high-affinity iron transporter